MADAAYNTRVFGRRLSWGTALVALLLGWAFTRPPAAGRPKTSPSARPAPRPSAPRTETEASSRPLDPSDPFASAASCAALVGAGQRLPRAPHTARFVSWNLHWFPDGVPGQKDSGVDLSWLGCALAWLDADVLAVQEVKQSAAAEQALQAALSELNRRSGGRYVARLDDCGRRVPQHVGLVWNEARAAASEVQTVAELNPHGSACESQLRPGLAARFRLPGGLDLQVVSAHFKSMADKRAFELRGTSFQAVPGLLRRLTSAAHDSDFLLLGDLNTMGCEDCVPLVSGLAEVLAVEQQLRGAGVRLVPADAAGTEFYQGRLTLLDHALAATAMRELPPGAQSHVAGACAAGSAPLTRRDAKQLSRKLSDHCPLVLDLTDRDLD